MPAPLTILPDPPEPPAGIGLIAGGGRLPIIVAEGLRRQGHPVHGLGLAHQYDPELVGLCHSFHVVGLLRIKSWARVLTREGVHHAIMVGRVDKAAIMHDPLRMLRNIPDLTTAWHWITHLKHDRRSHAVLAAVADFLGESGVQLIDSTVSIPEQLATAGVMTQRPPDKDYLADVRFVWPMLVEILKLDIGQAIAVRERDVIAVEAVEGTDRMIHRVGSLCKAKGWTLCKGARVGHDRRSDVPTVGIDTIKNLHSNGGRCLALAAGDVIMVDKQKMIELADRMGISIIGVPVGDA